jgi:hypothetical protein
MMILRLLRMHHPFLFFFVSNTSMDCSTFVNIAIVIAGAGTSLEPGPIVFV